MNQAGGVTEKHCVAGRPRHHAVDVDGQVVVVVVVVFIVVVFDGDKGGEVIMVDKDIFRAYLIFVIFLHELNFWRIKFTPKKRVNYDKIHRKLPIFCVITAKYTVN